MATTTRRKSTPKKENLNNLEGSKYQQKLEKIVFKAGDNYERLKDYYDKSLALPAKLDTLLPFTDFEPTKPWHTAFLTALSITSRVTRSAELAGIDRSTAYLEKRLNEDFSNAWDSALKQSGELLEDEVRRRAFEGVLKPVWHQGVMVGFEIEYSDTLLMFYLKAIMPDKYRERTTVEQSGKQDINHTGKVEIIVREETIPPHELTDDDD